MKASLGYTFDDFRAYIAEFKEKTGYSNIIGIARDDRKLMVILRRTQHLDAPKLPHIYKGWRVEPVVVGELELI